MNGRVDAHHHVWSLARGDYGWLTPALAPIYRDFSLADMAPLAQAAGITTTVLVQAAPTLAETHYLLDVAAKSGGLARGVVGWVDLSDKNAVATLESIALDPLFKSVRPMLQDLPDIKWVLRPQVQATLSQLPALGIRFDALVKPAQLPSLVAMLERNPDLDAVIDHGAKPDIAGDTWQPWANLMRAAANPPARPLQALGFSHGGGGQLDGRHATSVRRAPVRMLRPATHHVGQRLAGRRARRRLLALASCDARALARFGRRRPRRCARRQCAAVLRLR